MALPQGSRIMIVAPLVKDRKGEHQAIFEDLRKAGYVRVRVDGRIHDLSDEFQLDKNKKHSVEAVIDRLVVDQETDVTRVADSVETALKLGAGVVLVSVIDGEEFLFSEHFACVNCGISLGEIAPRTFSFNSPHGACPDCTGLGNKLEIDPELVVPNKNLSLAEGAIQPWSREGAMSMWYEDQIESVAQGVRLLHPHAGQEPLAEATERHPLRQRGGSENGPGPLLESTAATTTASRASSPTWSAASATRSRSTSAPRSSAT